MQVFVPCLRVYLRMECTKGDCEYGSSESRYILDERIPHGPVVFDDLMNEV